MTEKDGVERKKYWILIIDDEDAIRSLIKDKLEALTDAHAEYKTQEAADGQEAMKKLKNQKYDCIVTDLNMPRKTGQELIELVKKGDLNAKTPIIVVTAYPDATLPEMYLYLTMVEKPFKANDLIKMIKEQIKLGPIDQRIPVHIFNLFLEATENYFKDTYKLDLQRQAPYVKKGGGEFSNRSAIAIKIQLGPIKSWMAISADSRFLVHFAKSLQKTESQALEFLASGITARLSTFQNNNAKLEVHESIVISNKNINDYNLENLQGVTVPYKSSLGTVCCEAMVGNFELIRKT